MSLRLQSSASQHTVSLWGGLGIPGADIPASGDHGASPLYDDGLSSSAEYRIVTTAAPSAGILTVYPDTSLSFSAPDGVYTWVFTLYEDSAAVGSETVTFEIGVVAQFLRPVSDISNSGWTPSTGGSLAACIGEAVRDDATFISATAPGAICEVLLGTSSGDPLSSINHLPRIVMSAGSGGIILRLKQGATVIKAWTYASLPLTDTLHEPTLTSGEIDAISDYTDLRLEMETTP